MLLVSDLSLHFGDRTLFNSLSFSIQAGEKVALIGRNGTGKTTLFRVLAGEIKPDGGRREVPSDWRIGYLSQDIRPVRTESVWDIAMSAFEEARSLDQYMREIEEKLTANVLEGDSLEKALIDLEDGHHRLHVLGWEQAEGEAAKVLKGLGFQQSDFQKALSTFSGGWQVRVWLAKLLLERPQFLMLDEPTNHLDIEAILWLEQFLAKSEMALLLVSHDRRFLEACSSRIMELHHGDLDDYQMSYARYLDERELRFQQRQEAAESQQRKVAQMQATIDRFKAKASKASMAKSMEKQLAKMETIEMPGGSEKSMNLRFAPAPRSGQVVFDGRGLKKVYGEKTVFSDVDLKIDRGDRVAFIGQNGQGKTTLARIVTKLLPQDDGTIAESHQVQIGFYAQDQSERLDGKKTVLSSLEDEAGPEMRPQVRKILGTFLFSGEDVEKKVSVLSGGERARLALAELMLAPINLLVLDEPTNHLDMAAKEVLKRSIMAYDGTLLVVSHDRDFLSGLCDKIYYFKDGTIKPFLGDIDEFLRQQAVTDERLLAQRSDTGKIKSDELLAPQSPEWQEARKKAKKDLQRWEKEVEHLERSMKTLEKVMAEPGFYERPEAGKKSEEYQTMQQNLSQAELEWERCVERMGHFPD